MTNKQIYVGFDCSSKAIHGVLLDADEKLIHQQKWASSKKTYH